MRASRRTRCTSAAKRWSTCSWTRITSMSITSTCSAVSWISKMKSTCNMLVMRRKRSLWNSLRPKMRKSKRYVRAKTILRSLSQPLSVSLAYWGLSMLQTGSKKKRKVKMQHKTTLIKRRKSRIHIHLTSAASHRGVRYRPGVLSLTSKEMLSKCQSCPKVKQLSKSSKISPG